MQKKFKIITLLLMLLVLSLTVQGAGKKVSKEEIKFINILEKKVYPYELDLKGTPLSDALSSISKAAGVRIVAAADIVDLKIDLYLSKGQTLKRIVDTIKKSNRLSYRIINETMILSKNTKPEGCILYSKVSGRVTEIDKITGIKGVTLSLNENINTLVLSDVEGAFMISCKNLNLGTYILKATHKDYKTFSIPVEVDASGVNVDVIMVKKNN